MARIRSVKPELRTSLTAAEWPRDVRYLWVLLWGYLDDHGRGVDDARLVKADCLPLDDDVTRDTMEDWVGMITASGSLCRYVVDGRHYMHAPDWTKHQRPQHPKDSVIPPCPRCSNGARSGSSHEVVTKPSGDRHEDLTPEVEVEGVEGGVEGEGAHPPDAAADAASKSQRGTRIPEDFAPTASMLEWARKNVPGVDVTRETVKFVNHWTTESGKSATKILWDRAFQNWLLRAAEYAEERQGRASPGQHSPTFLPFDPEDV